MIVIKYKNIDPSQIMTTIFDLGRKCSVEQIIVSISKDGIEKIVEMCF